MTETRPRIGFAALAGQVPAAHGGRVWDFVALMKPRPMSVVVLTAIAGLLAAPVSLSPLSAVTAILCIALGGGGSAVLNMWFERDIDARMARTAARPLPSGRVTPEEALIFALVLITGSLAVMAFAVNPMAALMLGLTILFYGVVYTMWLKRLTALNVVIGGARQPPDAAHRLDLGDGKRVFGTARFVRVPCAVDTAARLVAGTGPASRLCQCAGADDAGRRRI